jgi:hypothetical protein
MQKNKSLAPSCDSEGLHENKGSAHSQNQPEHYPKAISGIYGVGDDYGEVVFDNFCWYLE